MIRVFFPDGSHRDLPDDTPADPFGEPGEDETPLTLAECRREGQSAFVCLDGQWRPVRIETWGAEAARMRAERDAAENHAARWKRLAKHLRVVIDGAEQDIAHLGRGAQAMLAVLRPGEPTDWKPSSIAADLVVWAEYVGNLAARADVAQKDLTASMAHAQRLAAALLRTTRALSLSMRPPADAVEAEVLARTIAGAAEALTKAQPGMTLDIAAVCARMRAADAAEKRLADLRAWAEDQNNWDGFHVPDVIDEVVARIDGKEE